MTTHAFLRHLNASTICAFALIGEVLDHVPGAGAVKGTVYAPSGLVVSNT
jgi:hypothetical protein